jgi:hypothetical protein
MFRHLLLAHWSGDRHCGARRSRGHSDYGFGGLESPPRSTWSMNSPNYAKLIQNVAFSADQGSSATGSVALPRKLFPLARSEFLHGQLYLSLHF